MSRDFDSLANSLRQAARAYYDGTTQTMTDAQYDDGIEQLKIAIASEPGLAERYADLLTMVAGGQSAGGSVVHPALMGSLDKAVSVESVNAFLAQVDCPVVVEPKLDGLAVRAVYSNGELTLVATRGDGHSGEDITSQAQTLGFLPLAIKGYDRLGTVFELRGEVYMADHDFLTASAHRSARGDEAFVNPRNAAAGILRKGSASDAGLLSFAVYDVISGTDSVDWLDSHTARINELRDVSAATTGVKFQAALNMGTWLPNPHAFNTSAQRRQEAVAEAITYLDRERTRLGFPIDGAVIKADRDSDRQRLGNSSRAPRWAVAYKFEAETATTKVVGITTDVGRTGRLSIRIEVEPVFVGGAKVTYATGHNVSWMEEKDIRIGDIVVVKRAGDVIPYIERVELDSRPASAIAWQPPESDPAGNPWDKSTLLWRSVDPALSAGASILYAASRDALDIDGMGVEIVDGLVEHGLTKFTELFELEVSELAELPLAKGRKLGMKTATKIIKQIDQSKTAPWARVITALGLRATGRTMSRRLAAAFPTLEQLRGATTDQLKQVEGIGAGKAATIRQELDRVDAAGVFDDISRLGITSADPDTVSADAPLAGMSVAVSGSVPGYTRNSISELIEAMGGKASGSVSATTTMLVSEPSTSSKYTKAQKLGINILTPAEFLKLVQK